MRARPRPRSWIAATAVVGLAATACGSSTHHASSTTATGGSTTTATGATTTTPSPTSSTTLEAAVAASIGGSVTGGLGKAPTVVAPKTPAPTKLTYQDLVVGKGATATATSTAVVQYVALNYATSKVFDSSWTGKSGPATLDLTKVVPGLALGIEGMRIGGRREIIVPPAYAFGSQGQGSITPNETVVFVVDLVSLPPPETAVAAPIGGSVTGPLGRQPTVVAPHAAAPTKTTYQDIVVGKGAVASPTSTVKVQYVGMDYTTGKVFDASWTKSSGPATFSLSQVIKGFSLGIAGMRVGGRREIAIPAADGYGSQAQAPITANENLLFVVDLLGVS